MSPPLLLSVLLAGMLGLLAHAREDVGHDRVGAGDGGDRVGHDLDYRGGGAEIPVHLGLPALFLYSSGARDGWASIMGPAWITTLALLLVDWTRRRVGRSRTA